MSAHKTFIIKRKLAKKLKQNRPIPQWVRMRTGNTIRYNAKRRHWRRTKLKLKGTPKSTQRPVQQRTESRSPPTKASMGKVCLQRLRHAATPRDNVVNAFLEFVAVVKATCGIAKPSYKLRYLQGFPGGGGHMYQDYARRKDIGDCRNLFQNPNRTAQSLKTSPPKFRWTNGVDVVSPQQLKQPTTSEKNYPVELGISEIEGPNDGVHLSKRLGGTWELLPTYGG
ncbi:hypothetical protein HW555_010755 [Spodoptera exigua]|nr:hypothetical protein HW555_010755 [Spodoptera exigua]